MGRTKRLRLRRKHRNTVKFLNSDLDTIDFVQWMTKNYWVDESKLRIAEFAVTGRGVLSLKSIKENDVLIEIPLHLMITYKTLEENRLFNSFIKKCTTLFSIHELLAIFILTEHHIGTKSEWYNYLKYLPNKNDLCLPWFCSSEEMEMIPEELKYSVEECKNNVLESWQRISAMLKISNSCVHCKKNVQDIIIRDHYEWAYTVVNTRAVYIDPTEIKKMAGLSLEKILSDEPTMALCPYLDMFNHSSEVTVKAVLIPNDSMPKYCLISGNKYKKYEEIFISYGAHDNKKLLCQYGFILPDNQFDTVEFTLKEVISVCRINTSSRQYKFLCDHSFNSDISVNSFKFSFNMSAVLYVLSHNNDLEWSLRVYTSVFTKEQLKLMYSLAEILLKWKLKQYENELEVLIRKVANSSPSFKLCVDYLKNRIHFITKIIHVK